jgi:hypothetical protein
MQHRAVVEQPDADLDDLLVVRAQADAGAFAALYERYFDVI